MEACSADMSLPVTVGAADTLTCNVCAKHVVCS